MDRVPDDQKLNVAILVCPNFAPMDVFGAHSVLGLAPNTEIHLVWKDKAPFEGVPRWPTRATTTFAECPTVDVLVIGATPHEILEDQETMAFIAAKAAEARAVIMVCGGVFLGGALGFLEGRRATTNFHMVDGLAGVGATPVDNGQIVVDGKFVTAGPVTGSFEAALTVVGALRGEEAAKMIELTIEFDPHPPFGVGSPQKAGPEMAARSAAMYAPMIEPLRETMKRVYAARHDDVAVPA